MRDERKLDNKRKLGNNRAAKKNPPLTLPRLTMKGTFASSTGWDR